MAKYNKQYAANRKIKTNKKVLDGLNYMGNPNITNELDNPEDESQVGNNAGQYAALGSTVVAGGANSYNTINDPNASIRTKSESMDGTVTGVASAINPLVGTIIGAGDMIGKPIRTNVEEMDEYGNLKNQRAAQQGAIAGGMFNPIKALTTRASYKGGWTDITGKGYTDAIQKEARDAYALANPKAAPIDNKDYSQDAAWQKLNNQTQLELGGNLTKYMGPSHADSPLGGIPVGQDSLVEGGETRGLPNTQSKDYIYSDTLKVPGKKYTFAKMSKMIESKHSKRDNDKMSDEQKELEINALMKTQEDLRTSMMDRAYKKAYGGNLNKKVMAAGGTVVVPPNYYETLNKYQTINPQNPKEANDVKSMVGSNIVPQLKIYQDQLNIGLRTKYKLAADAPITNQYLSPEEVNTILGGKAQDYYDNFEAYQAYRAKTPNMPGRSVDGTENVDPKVYGTRHVNLFKPYQTNTTVPTFKMGGNMFYGVGGPLEDEQEFIPEGWDQPAGPGSLNRMNTSLPEYQTQFPEEMQLKTVAPTNYDNLNQRSNNFNPNNIYNAGNFLGGAYDIYRGAKGGDDVNYERVTPETVNPELVNYETSRNLQRRDIKEGFRNVQQDLRNVNNPAQYLSLLTANAGQRDKTISDAIAKSYENETNTNSTIKGRANEFNAQAKNQGKYFNAQTQRAEADARQLEKDQASNTLQAGLASFGEALAGTGRDRQYRISEAESKKFIGSTDFSPIKDKSGKITGYTHKTSGKTYKIQ